jgi:hypothetical protein
MRGLLQARAAPGQKLSGGVLLHVSFRNAGGIVDVEFGPVYRTCVDTPADCERRVSEFVDFWAQHYGAVAAPDRSRIYASVWLEKNFAMLLVQGAGVDPVMAKFEGHLWTVCMSEGRPLPRTALETLGFTLHEAVDICTQNTVARQAPFEDAIDDISRGENRKIAGAGEAVLVLMHDLWAPVAKRFEGELLVCVAGSDTLYYGRGASAADVAAIEAHARRDAASAASVADPHAGKPDDFKFDVLRWTEKGWDIAN